MSGDAFSAFFPLRRGDGGVPPKALRPLPEASGLMPFLTSVYPREHEWNYLCSAVRNHMGDQVGIDPADHTGVHISDLKEVVNLRNTGSPAEMDYLSLSRDSHENANIGRVSNVHREQNFND